MSWEHPAKTVTIPKWNTRATIRERIGRTVTNLPVRVPTQDWAAVTTGAKTMFRAYNTSRRTPAAPVVPPGTECPRPCLLFTTRHNGPLRSRRYEAVPGVLLSHRQEPLGAISREDAAREGFKTLAEFKWFWKSRYRTIGWRPHDLISVIEVRPLRDPAIDQGTDHSWAAYWALDELLAEWL